MERLTTRHNGVAVIRDKSKLKEAMGKLAGYEEAEEQGLLLRLKLKVGDKVWMDYHTGEPYLITGYSFGEAEDYIDDPIRTNEVVYYYKNYRGSIIGSFAESAIGKVAFLTEAEANEKWRTE